MDGKDFGPCTACAQMCCGGCKANAGATGKVLDERKFQRLCTTDYRAAHRRWRRTIWVACTSLVTAWNKTTARQAYGTEKRPSRGLAAEHNNLGGMFTVGCTPTAMVLNKTPKRQTWYSRAAEQGLAAAQHNPWCQVPHQRRCKSRLQRGSRVVQTSGYTGAV